MGVVNEKCLPNNQHCILSQGLRVTDYAGSKIDRQIVILPKKDLSSFQLKLIIHATATHFLTKSILLIELLIQKSKHKCLSYGVSIFF